MRSCRGGPWSFQARFRAAAARSAVPLCAGPVLLSQGLDGRVIESAEVVSAVVEVDVLLPSLLELLAGVGMFAGALLELELELEL
ncbi:MAG: hypothetical protein Q8Q85_09730, partial [Gemmatimonadales bacterium]|nr:hypothetical protein [Gemmatimonadales bacterium]